MKPMRALSHDFALAGLAVLIFGFVIHASYPGYLDGDSLVQLKEALAGTFGDWHSPTIVLLWSQLLKLMPGPFGIVVFDNVLIWGGVAGIALVMKRRVGTWAILIVLAPLFPGAVNFLGNTHVDVMLAANLMAAACFAFVSKNESLPIPVRWLFQVLANFFILAAFLIRLNAIFSLIPLLLYANSRLGARRNLVMCIALLVAMPLIYKVQNTLLHVEPSYPGDSIKTYHLLALSYYEGRNLFPGVWTEGQSRGIVESCYSPIQWDNASSWGSCKFIARQLNWQHLWGSEQLTRTWLSEIFSHPLELFTALASIFKKSLVDPNSRAMLYRDKQWDWLVADNPPRASTDIYEHYLRSKFNDRVGRPLLFGVLSVLGIVLLFRWRLESRNEGRFALALLMSGLLYLLTYFFFNVSAESRYFYWCAFAAYVGLLIVLITAASIGWRALSPRPVVRPEVIIKRASLAIAALALALILFPFKMPTENRAVVFVPRESLQVSVIGIHNIATPKWMGARFEGEMDPSTWLWVGQSLHPTVIDGSLIARLEMLRESIEVELATGPGMGKIVIEGVDFHREIDTSSPTPGKLSVIIPPLKGSEIYPPWLLYRNVGWAILFFIGFLAVFLRGFASGWGDRSPLRVL